MYQSHIEAVGFLLSTHATSLHMVGETSLCTDHTEGGGVILSPFLPFEV